MVANMDDVVALAERCTTHAELHKELIPALKKLEKSTASSTALSASTSAAPAASSSTVAKKEAPSGGSILETWLQDGSDPLDKLDPAKASIAYLFILNARCHVATSTPTPEVWQPLYQTILSFAQQYNPIQLRMVPEQVHFFVRQLIFAADCHANPAVAMQPLKVLITRFAPIGTLTALHPIFLSFVLNTRSYAQARELLSIPIDDVDVSLYPIRYQDHLSYHYLGGVILSLLGNHAKAAEMLEVCVSAPGNGISAIQIDAYKKLVLIQLLAYGKPVALPSYVSPSTLNAAKNASVPYTDYAAAYGQKDKAKVLQLTESNREAFEKDHNYGLIILLQGAFRRTLIQNITETFISVKLHVVAFSADFSLDQAGYEAAEREVLSMLAERQIFGSLSPLPPSGDLGDKTLTFTDDPEPYDSHATVKGMTGAIARAHALEKGMRELEGRVGRSKEFVLKAYNQAGNSAGVFGGGGVGDDEMQIIGGTADWAEGTDDES